MHIRLLPCVAGLLAVGALLVAFPVPGDSFRTLHASDRCAEVVRRGQSLKPRGGGRGWSQKYDDLDDCLSLCTTGYKYVVENQSTGTCYCWRSDSDYRWSDDADNDQVHDVSDCQESSSVASRERDGYGGSTRAGELDECVDVSHHRTLKPSGGGRGWSLKYDDLGTCLSRCKRDDGYMHIVENTQTGQCYCYHIDEGNNYRWSNDDDDIGSDVLYNIATCFQLPKLDCPRDDEPGWIDQPKNMRCKEYYGNKFKLRRGYEYINYAGKRMSYDGSMGHCKTLCYAVINGDLEIPTPIWCKAVEYDEDDGDCTMYGGCRQLEDHRDGQVSVYCGVT
mmetsp:Transcript_47762/g.121862  ORF Transcript_47762/g.121862 Transcript_47762/m.121862 type:complete len:335 (+) Transcript_47762:259-1263(+)